jgi:deazaflavin-dependent oxidoreductase (nitroreductase family)
MAEYDEFNRKIIEEFRANDGVVGGPFEGAPLLILHSTGARSGEERVHPLVYRSLDDGYAIFASKAGADTHPAWYHNVVANPEVTVEVGTETKRARARVLEGAERTKVWEDQKRIMPNFAEYEANTSREIPVVVLEVVG